MPKLKIDDQEIEVEGGTSILQAAEMLGIEIPRFCYHDRLTVPANCRMCLVEVKGGPPKPQASCALACADGMEVETNSDMVRKARKGVMEFLLINHPLDCPICDQGGECDLQDQAMGYGYDRSRYYENKRAVTNKDLGPLIKTIMTRCIHCTRCIRLGEEIAGVAELGLLNRGEDVEIGTFVENSISSELSGNMIDVCPVGALTSRPYAYKARPWELTKTDSVDVHDAVGCNIRIDSRDGAVIRILPRLHEEVNEVWINDRSRFSYDGLRYQRLDRPYMRENRKAPLRSVSWEEAVTAAAARMKETTPNEIAALSGDLSDVESIVALKDIMKALGSTNYDCRSKGEHFDPTSRCGYIMNSGIAGLEKADALLLVGTFPRWEATMVNARIRKIWREKNIPVGIIAAHVADMDYTYPVSLLGDTPSLMEDILKGKHAFAETLKKAKRPAIIIGAGAFVRKDGAAIQAKAREIAEKFEMVTEGWNGFNVLQHTAGRVGALDVGFYKSDMDITKARLVYLLNVDSDMVDSIPDEAFVVYQGHHGDKGAARADLVLPGAAYSEKSSLYVNTEGRVQSTGKAVHPPGEAREDWKILKFLSLKLGLDLPYNTLFELRERIGKEWETFLHMDKLVPAQWTNFGDTRMKIEKIVPFKVALKNFYMSNVIARHSQTMVECEAQFAYKDE